jgi:hypothetical protein
MIRMLHKMGVRSGMMYSAGVASIGLSIAAWLASRSKESAGIDRADRWGIFVGQWAPTFFAVGVGLRIEETHPMPDSTEETMDGRRRESRGMPSRAGV